VEGFHLFTSDEEGKEALGEAVSCKCRFSLYNHHWQKSGEAASCKCRFSLYNHRQNSGEAAKLELGHASTASIAAPATWSITWSIAAGNYGSCSFIIKL
jgi:hypothetical protein